MNVIIETMITIAGYVGAGLIIFLLITMIFGILAAGFSK